MSAQNVNIFIAFFSGMLTFISPCILPLIPAYIAYATGVSIKEKGSAAIHSIMFVLGFSTIFILFGATATALGKHLIANQGLIKQIGGFIIIIFGLFMAGAIRIPFLYMEKRFELKRKPTGLFGSYMLGMAFSAGWTPCVGPILATILVLASTSESILKGVALLFSYSMGLGIPFILTAMAISKFSILFNRIKKYLGVVSLVSGIFLVIVGILMLMNRF